MKTKYRSSITQAQGYLPHVVMFDQWKHWIQTTLRLNSLSKWRKARMIWLASNFAFTWVFPITCACASLSGNWKPGLSPKKIKGPLLGDSLSPRVFSSCRLRRITRIYYMANSLSGQDEPGPALWGASQEREPSCPLIFYFLFFAVPHLNSALFRVINRLLAKLVNVLSTIETSGVSVFL